MRVQCCACTQSWHPLIKTDRRSVLEAGWRCVALSAPSAQRWRCPLPKTSAAPLRSLQPPHTHLHTARAARLSCAYRAERCLLPDYVLLALLPSEGLCSSSALIAALSLALASSKYRSLKECSSGAEAYAALEQCQPLSSSGDHYSSMVPSTVSDFFRPRSDGASCSCHWCQSARHGTEACKLTDKSCCIQA